MPFKNAQLVPKPLTSSLRLCALALKQCIRRILIQQTFNTVWISFYRSDQLKPILPPSNWLQQSTFETRHHNHFKCCTTSKFHTVCTCGSQPLFWQPHAAPKHPLCNPQRSFNKTSNILYIRLRSAIKQNISIYALNCVKLSSVQLFSAGGQSRTPPHFHPWHRHPPYCFLCGLWVSRRRTNCRPCCLPMSNLLTCSWTTWPDGSGRWDNWMACQHLPRDLVQPSSGLNN